MIKNNYNFLYNISDNENDIGEKLQKMTTKKTPDSSSILVTRTDDLVIVSLLDQTLRLIDGYRNGEGRVELFHDGHWGTVCDDFWDIKDAQVVCRQLGFDSAVVAHKLAIFGEGNGHIWLDNVHCVGNESSIESCPHNGWNDHNCGHYEDAAVICRNGTLTLG